MRARLPAFSSARSDSGWTKTAGPAETADWRFGENQSHFWLSVFRAGPNGLPCYPQATARRYALPARSARSVGRPWGIPPPSRSRATGAESLNASQPRRRCYQKICPEQGNEGVSDGRGGLDDRPDHRDSFSEHGGRKGNSAEAPHYRRGVILPVW